MFEKYFNRPFEMIDIPCFVPIQELEKDAQFVEYERNMVEQGWVPSNWRALYSENGAKGFTDCVKRIVAHGGLILEIAAGPGGGFVPYILSEDYQAHVMISDLSPAVGREWKKLLNSLKKSPPNVEYAAIDARELPFSSNSLDVISGTPAIAEIENGKDKALKEIYRVLKQGGLFVMNHVYIQIQSFQVLDEEKQNAFLSRWPESFSDYSKEIDELKFSSVEKANSFTRIVDADSEMGSLANKLGIELIVQGFTMYCKK